MRCRPMCARKNPFCARYSSVVGNDVIVQDALERKLYVIRKTASAHIQRQLKHSKEYYGPA